MSTPVAIIKDAGEGEKRWFAGGGLHIWKATAEETGGSLMSFEDVLTAGKVTPLHCHPEADEVVVVLEGEILVENDGVQRRLSAGGFTFAPRGVAHAFVVLSPTARVIGLQTPGSGDAFYRNASDPVEHETDSGPVDFERIGQVARSTGATQILGPPPFDRAPTA